MKGEYRHCGTKARAKIHVFCPPLLQYIHFALALASQNHRLKTHEFQVVIHPDDRLLDEGRYSVKEGRASLSQSYDYVYSRAQPGRPIDTLEPGTMLKLESRRQYLATRFDQVWMDQRITAIGMGDCTGDPIDASDFFKDSHEAAEVALAVIMAGPQVCDYITRTAPLIGPDNPIKSMQIYRLEELADVDDRSLFRWKTTHFCRINSP